MPPRNEASCTCLLPFWGSPKTSKASKEFAAIRFSISARSKEVDKEILGLKFDNQELRKDTIDEFDILRAEIYGGTKQERSIRNVNAQRRMYAIH